MCSRFATGCTRVRIMRKTARIRKITQPQAPGNTGHRMRPALWVLSVAAALVLLAAVLSVTGNFQWLFRSESASEKLLGDPHINAEGPTGPAPEGMVWIPGGTFWM